MKRSVNAFLLISCAIGLIACSVGQRRGVVAMKISDTDAHICIGKNEVNVGQRASIYRNECEKLPASSSLAKNTGPNCKKVFVGDGAVKEVLNSHYSVLRLDRPIDFREGDVVEFPAS